MTLHLLAPGPSEGFRALADTLRHEHIAMVYAGSSPGVVPSAEELAGLLGVDSRADAGLVGLDVSRFGAGAHPNAHCTQTLEDIADLHRGEHVLVIGDVPSREGAVLRRLEIGDDGWRLLPEGVGEPGAVT
ncbi:MAG TPA: hypothetical protein PK868_06860 [Phycicoccus sp.]|nr:hypothetical protein [Phycicoccus sp.]